MPNNTPAMYRTNQRELMAVQWTGDNDKEIQQWIGQTHEGKEGFSRVPQNQSSYLKVGKLYVAANGVWLNIQVGSWIMRDMLGFYPCDDVVFRKNYEEFDATLPAPTSDGEGTVVPWAKPVPAAEGVIHAGPGEALLWIKSHVNKSDWPALAGLLLGTSISEGLQRARRDK